METTRTAQVAASHEADEAFINTTSLVGSANYEGAETTTSPPTPQGEAGEAASTAHSSVLGDGVVTSTSGQRPKRRVVCRQAAIVAANPATGANCKGIAWSLSTTHIDNARSQKRGVALKPAMVAQGIADFDCGDLVEIEVGVGAARHRLIGRASRPSTAYFWIADLTSAGIALHEGFNLVIVAVHRASPPNRDQITVTA